MMTISLKAGEVMLIGEFTHSIDDKGRVRIPKNFREALGETFYITKGFDKCLLVYPEARWNEFLNNLKDNDATNPDVRRMQRFFTGSAMAITLDSQGRTVISQALRKHALIEKEISLVGMNDKIEIWSTERWNGYNDEIDDISGLASKTEGFKM